MPSALIASVAPKPPPPLPPPDAPPSPLLLRTAAAVPSVPVFWPKMELMIGFMTASLTTCWITCEITERITLPQFTAAPWPWMNACDIALPMVSNDWMKAPDSAETEACSCANCLDAADVALYVAATLATASAYACVPGIRSVWISSFRARSAFVALVIDSSVPS